MCWYYGGDRRSDGAPRMVMEFLLSFELEQNVMVYLESEK